MDAREGRGRKSLSQFGDGPGKIVTVHIRTVEFEKLHLSQIGCAVVGSDQAFFRAIKTAGLETYVPAAEQDGRGCSEGDAHGGAGPREV